MKMNTEVWQVVGIVKRKGKTGVTYTTLHLNGFHTDYDLKNAEVCDGTRCLIETTSAELPPVHLGDCVELLYAKGFEDKAVLRSLIVVQGNPFEVGKNGKK